MRQGSGKRPGRRSKSLAEGAEDAEKEDSARSVGMTEWQGKNLLCYGDNLGFLTDSGLLPNECVDLIYLDPPFNSQQNYNILFKEVSGTPEAAQIKAFEDTWTWDMAANEALTLIHTDQAVPGPLVELMKTFMHFLKPSPMMAYLVQMAIRLVHMHRVLKPTGSLYLHCDPTASHYLKLVLDGIFGPKSFRNEIVWKRTAAHSDSKRWSRVHDVILFFAKGEKFTWNPQYEEHSTEYVSGKYRHRDEDGRCYRLDNITSPHPRPNMMYEWKGFPSPPFGWRFSKETMAKLDAQGRIWYPSDKGKRPQVKRYLEESEGRLITTVWTDISPINSQAQERLGYPTQKPLELLRRIVSASSNPGDVILDPFCGCGTTVDAVETINAEVVNEHIRRGIRAKERGKKPDTRMPPLRRWIGIDVTHLSINLIKHRLTRFSPPPVYDVIGEPTSVAGAEMLARNDRFQFQYWAMGLIGARPWGGVKSKGADQGIDGVRLFMDEVKEGHEVYKKMLVQVKSGKVSSKDIRDLVGTMSRENAELSVFITLAEPTAPMKQEAGSAGMYASPWDGKPYPRVQILTIADLLADPYRPNPRCLMVPGGLSGQHTLPEPPKHKNKSANQSKLFKPEP